MSTQRGAGTEMQEVKFYQTGTFTVGNRLLAEDERSVQANMRRTNSLELGTSRVPGLRRGAWARATPSTPRCAPRRTR